MKKILFTFLAALCCTMMVNAQTPDATKIEYESGKYMYFILDNSSHTASVTSYKDESYNSTNEYIGAVQVPATVTYDNETYSVTGIGNAAFENCTGLTSISLQEGITSIGNDAFKDCSGLENAVVIPSTVNTVGDRAFYDCTKLTSVNVKGGSIGGSAFWNCTSLTSLSLQEGVTSIGKYAFNNCSGIIEGVIIPSTVTTIGNYAFNECTNLPSVTVKGGSIGDNAFSGCAGLTSVSLLKGVTSIGAYAFYYISGIEGDLIIPSTVTSVGSHAFYHLDKLSSVTVKGGSLGDYAFSGCTGLTSVSLQEGVTNLGGYVFENCSKIEGALVIPSTVTSIGNAAFSGCTGLTSISIPEGVTSIGNYAFYGCSGVEQDLVIPSTVTTVGDAAFSGCTGLTSVSISEGVTTIGDYAFDYCTGMKGSLEIPSTVTSIGDYAFSGCENFPSIYVFPSARPSLGEGAFENVEKNIPVYVPDTDVYAGWGEFTNIRLINFFKLNGEKYGLDEDGEIEELEFKDKVAFQSYHDFTANKLTYSRTFANTDWQPLYVPFAMSYDEWKKDFDVAAINNFHEYTDLDGNTCKTELEVRLVKSGTLKPNHPYLICAKRADASNPQTIDVSSRKICKSVANSIACSSVERKYTFTGTYEEMTGLKTNGYIFLSGGKLYKAADDDVKLGAQRWYLSMEALGSQIDDDDNGGARAIQFDIKVLDGDATDIDEITVTRTPLLNDGEAMYNLNGMRVDSSYRGIVIWNGKKFLQK